MVAREPMRAEASSSAWRGATLGGRLAALDADRLIGRRRELALLEGVLDRTSQASVVFVHGPVGIGKSALLRAAARAALDRGYSVHSVDGRSLLPLADALAQALAPAFEAERPVVLLDDYERIDALGDVLRRDLLPTLSEDAVVLVGSRKAPEAGWSRGGWESLVAELRLRGLSRTEAYALLALMGHYDEREMRRIVVEARGSPLLLSLAGHETGQAGSQREEPKIAVLRHLAEAELDEHPSDVLATAAIARQTTVELLEFVLADPQEARAGYRWLASRSFVEKVGTMLRLHDAVKSALVADLQLRAPEVDRDLRRRIADYYAGVAREGRPFLAIELAHLVLDPSVRWAIGWQGSPEYHVEGPETGDLERIGDAMRMRGTGEWWERTETLVRAAPELAVVVRDAAGRPCGYVVSTTPGSLPAAAAQDGIVAATVRHALENAPDGNVVVVHDTQDLVGGPAGDRLSPIQGVATMAAFLRSGFDNPRRLYVRVDARAELLWAEAATSLRASRLPELDRRVGSAETLVFAVDFGEAGLVGALHSLARGEVGSRRAVADEQLRGVDAETVREALRTFHVSEALAASKLAEGVTVEERAASVRATVRAAVERAFGPSAREQALREIVVRAYLTPGSSHDEIASALYLSRSTYFRRLRSATERVVDGVLADRASGA